ncbi:hypothetical protein ACI65C_011655 [Semiaphis heraclei]
MQSRRSVRRKIKKELDSLQCMCTDNNNDFIDREDSLFVNSLYIPSTSTGINSQSIQETSISSFHDIPDIVEINVNENCNLSNTDQSNNNSIPSSYTKEKEAKSKTNCAQFFSDLSANEDSNAQRLLKSKSKMESPPSLRLNIEDGHDSDKDPDYHKPISVNESHAMTNRNNKYVMNSPIGKILIEESNLSIMSSMPPKQPFIESIALPSPQWSNRSSKYNTELYGMPNIVSHAMTNRNNKYVMNSPIGKILIEETSPSIMSSMLPKQPFIESIALPSPQRSNTTPLSQRSNTTSLTRPIKRVLFPTVEPQGSNRSSKYNTEYDCGMTDTAAFKNFVVSSLTKVKHEISAIHSTVNSSYMVLEGFINNFGQSRATKIAMQYESGCSLDDFFPITNEEDLQLLNNKIKSDKQFRLNMMH